MQPEYTSIRGRQAVPTTAIGPSLTGSLSQRWFEREFALGSLTNLLQP
jgi:hypothetical protein